MIRKPSPLASALLMMSLAQADATIARAGTEVLDLTGSGDGTETVYFRRRSASGARTQKIAVDATRPSSTVMINGEAIDPALTPRAAGGRIDVPETGSAARERGVLVELDDAPAFEVISGELDRGATRERALQAGNAQREKIAGKHRSAIGKLGHAFKKLVRPLGRVFGFKKYKKAKKLEKHVIEAASMTDAFNGFALRGVTVEEARTRLAGMPGIRSITPNQPVRLLINDAVNITKANQVWPVLSASGVNLDGTGMRVGVVDSGVDYRHPDLGGCFGTRDADNRPINCKVVAGYDFVHNHPDPMDDLGHGTHIASIVAGNGFMHKADGTLTPMRGIAPEAKIYAYKVADRMGSSTNENIIRAIEYCGDPNQDGNPADHLDVCTLSLGGPGTPDDLMSKAMDRVTRVGVLFTVSAGNEGARGAGTIGSPAVARSALTVGASCKPADVGRGKTCLTPIADFSSRGPVKWQDDQGASQTLVKPDIVAPGHKICAARWSDSNRDLLCGDSSHVALSGTSMAAPVVAGVAILLRQAHPELTSAQIKKLLMDSARPFDSRIDANAQGKGEVDAMAALNLSGFPSSFIRFTGGLPLVISDEPTSVRQTYARTFQFTNVTSQALTYVPTWEAEADGLTAVFDKPAVTLAPGARGELTATVSVDHARVPGPMQVTGLIRLASGAGTARVGVSVVVGSRLAADRREIDLGLHFPEDARFESRQRIALTNVMRDLGSDYRVELQMPEGIVATVDRPAFNLAPGASTELGLTVVADNARGNLRNGRYDGLLKIISPMQSLVMPIRLYKGYAIRTRHTDEVRPELLEAYDQAGKAWLTFHPDPGQTYTDVYVPSPGPWFIAGTWPKEYRQDGTITYTIVLRDNLSPGRTPLETSVTKDLARNRIEFAPTQPDGNPGFYQSFQFYLIDRRTLHTFGSSEPNFDHYVLNISDVGPATALAALGAAPFPYSGAGYRPGWLDPEALQFYSYHLHDGITSSMRLTNRASDFFAKDMISHPNQHTGETPLVTPTYFLGTTQVLSTKIQMSLPAGRSKKLYVMNATGDDPRTSGFEDVWTFGFTQYFTHQKVFENSQYNTPMLHVTSRGELLAWREPDGYEAAGRSQHDAFLRNVVELPPGDRLVIGGLGPMMDTMRWYVLDGGIMRLAPQIGAYTSPHVWPDHGDEYIGMAQEKRGEEIKLTASVSRDGGPATPLMLNTRGGMPSITLSEVSPANPSGATLAGDYVVEYGRKVWIDGFETQVKTVQNFRFPGAKAYLAGEMDVQPPALRHLHLEARGDWQSRIDSAAANTLVFELDPTPRVRSNEDSATGTTYPDSLTRSGLEVSIDGGSWAPVTLGAGAGANRFQAVIPTSASARMYGLRISGEDQGGNRMSYQFQMPSGDAVAPRPVAQVERPPATTAPTTPSVTPGQPGAPRPGGPPPPVETGKPKKKKWWDIFG